ncbi:GAF domain-containing protein [Seinonella peptonophila]|uniref:GAF domain-containing protein n=1 Tax=Seinonella peptonophila TaxID=112248 RepID=A0A1M4T0Z2_9BACL|nr:GAF domain-containing protein [Seinonella peptonophila]SHE38085.1 GAF domain-containing protein [Seinonella peptonophila]
MEEIFRVFNILFQDGSWFAEFFKYFVSIALVTLFILFAYQYATGKTDVMGRPQDGDETPASIYRIETLQRIKDELEEKVVLLERERKELTTELVNVNRHYKDQQSKNKELEQTLRLVKKSNETLKKEIDNEMYVFLQIMGAVDEIAAAIANWSNFLKNRDDIYVNILDYMISTMKDFRKKDPRIVLHVEHPKYEDRFIHFAHSSSHTHRVKQFEPLKHGSAAGYSWRENQVYYVPDVNDDSYDYQRKSQSRRHYRTVLCVPLSIGNDDETKIGVLSVTGYTMDAYTDKDIETVILFVHLIYPLVWLELKENKRQKNNAIDS